MIRRNPGEELYKHVASYIDTHDIRYKDIAKSYWPLTKEEIDQMAKFFEITCREALLESGSDAEIIDIKQRVEDAGFIWALDKASTEPFEIVAVRAVINAYHLLGGATFSRMLVLMAGTWHGTPASLKACMFSGMALFLKTYETELSDHAFIKRMSAVDPEEIIRRGKADFSTNKAALRFARVILEKFNGHQRGGYKLPYRYKG